MKVNLKINPKKNNHGGTPKTPKKIELLALAGRAEGKSCQKISDELGIHRETVRLIGLRYNPSEIAAIKKTLSDQAAVGASVCLDNTIDKASSLNAYQSAIAAAALIDKMRLLDNQSTSIVDYPAISRQIVEIETELAEYEEGREGER